VVVVRYVTRLEPKELAAPPLTMAVLTVKNVWVGPPLGNVVAVVNVDREVPTPPWKALPTVDVAVVKYVDVAVLKLAPPLKPGTVTIPVEVVK